MKSDIITGRVIPILLAVTVLGSIFMVQTNSRTSILIKETVYVGGTSAALFLMALHTALRGRIISSRLNLYIVLSFLVLMAWMVFMYHSGTRSVNAGQYMFSTFALGGLVFLISASFRGGSRDMLLWVLVSATVLLCLYSILQSLGIIIFSWDAGLTRAARSSGTMGNANLLGSFAMAMLPAGSGFLLSRKKLGRFYPAAGAAFAILCMGALLVSKTRGSLIGIAGILAAVPFFRFMRESRKRLLAVILVLLLLLAGAVLFLGSRMEELAETDAGTFQVRKLIWSGTMGMVLEKPLTGYGPGSFQIVFPRFRNPSYFLLGVSHNTLHAHCEYLEIVVDTGISGLLLWAAAAAFIFRKGFSNRKSIFSAESSSGSPAGFTAIGLVLGITALLAEATVSVGLRWPPSALLLALFTGLLLACIKPEYTELGGVKRAAASAGLLAAALFLALAAFPDYLKSMKSGRQLFRGKDMNLVHIQPNLQRAAQAAGEWRRNGNDSAMQNALQYFYNARAAADSALTWCEKCVETNPDDLGGWYALGSAYVSSARLHQQVTPALSDILALNGIEAENWTEANRLMEMGLAAYDSLMKRAPDYAEVHNNLALIYIHLGRPESALSSIRRAWDLHVHNRPSYIPKIRILNTLVNSMDGLHLKWRNSLGTVDRITTRNEDIPGRNKYELVELLSTDYGLAFMVNSSRADSLSEVLRDMLSEYSGDAVDRLNESVDVQIRNLSGTRDLVVAIGRNDRAAVLENLSRLDDEELKHLPLESTVNGMQLAEQGDIRGMEAVSRTLINLSGTSFNWLVYWPVDVSDMFSTVNEGLVSMGLKEREQKDLFLQNLKNMLEMDRRIFETVVFIESSSELRAAAEGEMAILEDTWREIGGPLYCYMRLRNAESESPAFSEGSLLQRSYGGLLELEAEDTTTTAMLEFRIQWLFVLFAGSYTEVPHYSSYQTSEIVRMMGEARRKLSGIAGEDQTSYLIGRILSNELILPYIVVRGDFYGYLETLKNDLVLNRIQDSDLP